MSVEANIRRIAVDYTDEYRAPTNLITGGVIYLPRSRDIALQLGISENNIWLLNPSHLVLITAEVRPFSNRTATAILTANTTSISVCQAEEWASGTNQHATITFPQAQTASIASADSTDYWLVITAVTTNAKPLTLLAGRCVGVDDGGNYSATVPAPADPAYFNKNEVLAMLASQASGEIVENGYRGKWGIDVNGAPRWIEIV